jgi:hypothetical protein
MIRKSDRRYDVVIAGAGSGGLLTLMGLLTKEKPLSILVLDAAPQSGGRLALHQGESWPSGGVSFMGPVLAQFLRNFLCHWPEGLPQMEDLLLPDSEEEAGVFSGKTMTETGPRARLPWLLGTRSAGSLMEEILADPSPGDSLFSKVIKRDRKDPSITTLSHIARLFGVTDLLQTAFGAVQAGLSALTQPRYSLPWNSLGESLLTLGHGVHHVDWAFGAQVLQGSYRDDLWTLETEKGVFWSSKLIVAQPPWQALPWMDQDALPVPILNMALKFKPTSLLCLSEALTGPFPIPQTVLIPSDGVELFCHKDNSLTYQVLLDYESSFDPSMGEKAIRRLKRAHDKIHRSLSPPTRGEHIALVSVAWPHSFLVSDRKNKPDFSTNPSKPHLGFVGDAYGNSFDPEENLTSSLTQTLESLCL